MTPPPIPVIRVAGSHRDVGRQLGESSRDRIVHELDVAFAELPAGRSKDQQLALAAAYRSFTEPRLPC